MKKIHTYEINGIWVKTGDIICTTNSVDSFESGQFWKVIGMLIPGEVDHVAMYVGPEGRCIEAGPAGVIEFKVTDNMWNAQAMKQQRYGLVDRLYGVAFPIYHYGIEYSQTGNYQEVFVRKSVAQFCIAQIGKLYNLNFLDPWTQEVFYCSQLIWRAYELNDIDLNTGRGVPNIPGTKNIIYPQEIWESCAQRMVPVNKRF